MEREELAELFQTYGTDVFRLAFSYLGSRPDAEDICQSVFLKLAEGRQGPRPGKEKSWLLACTANACKSHLRSFWYRSVGELDEAALFQDGEDRAVYALRPKALYS
jgi:RNA polymerase sigma factor (sigma-70 family)